MLRCSRPTRAHLPSSCHPELPLCTGLESKSSAQSLCSGRYPAGIPAFISIDTLLMPCSGRSVTTASRARPWASWPGRPSWCGASTAACSSGCSTSCSCYGGLRLSCWCPLPSVQIVRSVHLSTWHCAQGPALVRARITYRLVLVSSCKPAAGCEEHAGPAAEAAGGCQCQHPVGRLDATAGVSAAGSSWTSQNSPVSSVFQQKEAAQ